jgi:hypothetical protein
MTMVTSTRNKAREAIGRLEQWIDSTSDIPQHKGRANKAQICRLLGISRSTADANPRIRELLQNVEVQLAQTMRRHAGPVAPSGYLPKDMHEAAPSLTESVAACRQSAAVEHLLKTGRVVR